MEKSDLYAIIGDARLASWDRICALIDKLYDMETIWGGGGKNWDVEYKFRRGGKTLCALYARQDCFGFMIIFGKAEREKVEIIRDRLSPGTLAAYDSATVYHDGKWVMFDENIPTEDVEILLEVKRKPNKLMAFDYKTNEGI